MTLQSLDTMKSAFNSLVERTQVGVYLLKGNRFSYVNQTLADIFGYSAGEMINMKVSDVMIRSEWHELQALLQKGDSDHSAV